MSNKAYGGAPLIITRPANTNVYGANDVVGAVAAALTIPDMGAAGDRILITSVALAIDLAGIPAGMTSFRLHLYDVSPPSAFADEATWDLPAGDRAAYLGFIDLGSPIDVGSTLYVQSDQINKQVKLKGSSLFGYLVTIGTYTAASGCVHRLTLNAVAL